MTVESFVSELCEQMNCAVAFTIHTPWFDIPIKESVVVTWIIMAVFTLLSIILVRNLKVDGEISKKQHILEICIGWLRDFFVDLIGEKGKRFVPFMMTIAIFIGSCNIIGLFGLKPPTKDMNVTAGLALAAIVLIQVSGIVIKGVKGWIKSFTEPVAIVTPINIMELAIRPTSLCMRLFGNVLGAFIIMEMLKAVCPFIAPTFFSLYFDIFDGLIQAYVFIFLTSLFINEAIE